MRKNFGIVLGRLSKKRNQKLQSFPNEYLKDLNLIKNLGIQKVEWLVDKPRLDNPIFELDKNYGLKNLLSNKINILIEANQDPLKLIEIIKSNKLKNVFLLYDLGNYSEMNRDIIFDIKNCHNFIKEIHLKDKYKNKNDFFGKGNVDFKNFLRIYKKLNLKIPLIFENYVGISPYINTKKQMEYITLL